jgi:peptidoglycan hydrolase-like protein with peptidoglycan-binding domain
MKMVIRHRLLVTTSLVIAIAFMAGCAAEGQPVANALPPATAQVTRTTLVETRTVPGTLGYGVLTPINAIGNGIITWLAPVGTAVSRGEPLFRVNELPVIALYGPVPMYRTLEEGIQGTDVRQLQENLAELGYSGISVNGTYTAATARAVRAWQADLGLPETGTVEPGQVAFIPGAMRIAEHTALVGDALRGVPVLSYTGLDRLVTVHLGVVDRALAIEGQTVSVIVPGIGTVEGETSTVGTVFTAQGSAGSAPGSASSAASDVRIEVTITIADQEALGSLDAAPVEVGFVSEAREDVLTVPVAALLALVEGGYGVEVVEGDVTRILPVRTGMFAAGRVEISGEGIAEGITVGVAR